MQVSTLFFRFLTAFALTGQLCGVGWYILSDCSSATYHEDLPTAGKTWQIDIDTTNSKVIWWNPSDYYNKARLTTIGDFSNIHHIVMVSGGGTFELNVDNSFLKTRYDPTHVSFPTSTSVNVGNGETTRIIGEKITATNVTSYQLTFTSYGTNMCFGLISIPDIDTVTLDDGDFTTHWGVCVDDAYPVDQQTIVCPCSNCATGCATCDGAAQTDCISCKSGYYGPPCNACDSACSVCTGPSDNQCSACNSGYFLHPTSTACYSSCLSGYWNDTDNHICAPCNVACDLCSGGTHTECHICNSGYFLQPSSTVCLDSCPNGYWSNSGNNNCDACNPACASCNGGSNICTACKSGYFLQPPPSNAKCLNFCPTGYWQDTTNHICAPCDTSCSVCSGGTNTQCSACNSGFFLLSSSTTCLNSCPDGSWRNPSNMCLGCDSSCSVCMGPNDIHCSACNSGYFLFPAHLSPTTCSIFCPSGYWEDTTNHICAECNSACSDCIGPSNTECSSCNTGYFLQSSSTTCRNSCPDGSWPNSTSNTCENCDVSCAICTGPDNTQCSACNPDYFLQPSSTICLSSCPAHYYTNTLLNTCESIPNLFDYL